MFGYGRGRVALNEVIERVAAAIDGVQLFSRYNDWTSDRVEGCPIEICRHGKSEEDDVVVVARYGGNITEEEARCKTVSEFRARAAIEAVTASVAVPSVSHADAIAMAKTIQMLADPNISWREAQRMLVSLRKSEKAAREKK